jgi:putative PIN family toxin of toxin-antitoxin system
MLNDIEKEALFIESVVKISECRDPKDNKFLELAVAGNADCIVTGDKDLLVLNPYRGTKIISPANFFIHF